jgi:hypothetical protein
VIDATGTVQLARVLAVQARLVASAFRSMAPGIVSHGGVVRPIWDDCLKPAAHPRPPSGADLGNNAENVQAIRAPMKIT